MELDVGSGGYVEKSGGPDLQWGEAGGAEGGWVGVGVVNILSGYMCLLFFKDYGIKN